MEYEYLKYSVFIAGFRWVLFSNWKIAQCSSHLVLQIFPRFEFEYLFCFKLFLSDCNFVSYFPERKEIREKTWAIPGWDDCGNDINYVKKFTVSHF